MWSPLPLFTPPLRSLAYRAASSRCSARIARTFARRAAWPAVPAPASLLATLTAANRQHNRNGREHSYPWHLAAFFPAALVASCEAAPPARRLRNDETICILAADTSPASLRRLREALQSGADPNATRFGWTGLHAAAVNGNVEAARVLLEHGADVNSVDAYGAQSGSLQELVARHSEFSSRLDPRAPAQGMTALHYAAMFNDERMVTLLLQHGADPQAKTATGHTPADCATMPALSRTLRDEAEARAAAAEAEKRRQRAENPLHKRLKEHIIGQDAPIDAVSAAIRRKENGWHDDDHPMVFLFLGSSGIGKTELAKRMAQFLFDDKQEGFIRFDMSEYQTKHEVAKFIGAPPGYIGHDQGGQLVNSLQRFPQAVVLLDEVEKAHPDVLTVLLQLFDEGRLTDSQGHTVDCKEAIFVMTSNLAQDQIADYAQERRSLEGPNAAIFPTRDFKEQVIRPILKQHFRRDEFLGRIHEILYFWPFSETQLALLASKELQKWSDRAHKRHSITLSWDPTVVDLLVSHYDIHYGARSLQHAVNTHVINMLAGAHEEGRMHKGDHVHLSVLDGKVMVAVTSSPSTSSGSALAAWLPWGGRREGAKA